MPYKDPIKAKIKKRECYEKNKDVYSKRHKTYNKEHQKEISENKKKYYIENREKILENRVTYRKENIDKFKEKDRLYNIKNRRQISIRAIKYEKDRNKCDPEYKLRKTLRKRFYMALKNNQKSGSAVRDLGCTIPELKFYLENQFQEGMTWDNWTFRGWHIDHKVPLTFFALTDRTQLLKAVHYTNLQPMWWLDNIKKSNKIIN